jgi:hypothetical protein
MKENLNPQNDNLKNHSSPIRTRDDGDLTDSEEDKKKLLSAEFTIELPDVKDIPGQEFINPLPFGLMADTTISSADEEGEGLFEEGADEDLELIMGTEADITNEEKETLKSGEEYMPTRDEGNLQRASLDNADLEGIQLNYESFGSERTGADLDVPGSEADDELESAGGEDEENNAYSLGSEHNDNITEGRT